MERLEWHRDRRVRNAPWVGSGHGCTYRLFPTHEFAIVRVTLQLAAGGEIDLGVFPTLDGATRYINAHYREAEQHRIAARKNQREEQVA